MKFLGFYLMVNLLLLFRGDLFAFPDQDENLQEPTSKTCQATTKKRKRPVKIKKPVEIKKDSKSLKKARLNEEESLANEILSISRQIQKAHRKADAGKIYKAYKRFMKLDYEPEHWQSVGNMLKPYQWPSQKDWKEIIGAHLFHPSSAIECEESPCYQYLLKLKVALWAFAIGAKFKHPVSLYYLAKEIDEIRFSYSDADKPEFFTRSYADAFADLEKCQDNADACYILGRAYQTYPYRGEEFEPEKAYELFKKGDSLRNKFQMLETTRHYQSNLTPPSMKDYCALGNQGYGPASIQAARLAQDFKGKLKILKETSRQGYAPALLEIAYLYEEEKEVEKARKYYLKAGEKEVSQAYIDMGQSFVGDVMMNSKEFRKDLKTLSQKDIDQAVHYFTLAGEKGNPKGWDYLIMLYVDLYGERSLTKQKKKDITRKIFQTIQKGIAVGSARAYHMAFVHFRPSFEILVKKYGPAPQEKLYVTMESFLNKKD
ncbi:MAG: hypothetical protein BGO67_12865 [Alphaproteobacteria bacterium 41-28]|mgnify:CR=1 FL=1|nr:MAG: hypothetical protein BGO67_12865 [Alphaproteobacteria bacterium 41-28]